MRLSVKILILFLCIIISSLIFLPLFLDNSSLKYQIEQQVSHALDNDFEIKKEIDFFLFPSPKIVISDIYLNNFNSPIGFINLHVKNLTAKLSITSLLRKKIKVDGLIFDSPTIELHSVEQDIAIDNNKKMESEIKDSNSKLDSMELAEKIFGIGYVGSEMFNFKDLSQTEVHQGLFVKKDVDGNIDFDFKDITFKMNRDVKRQLITINGKFFSKEIPTEIEMVINAKKDTDSKLAIYSPILAIEITGKFGADSNIRDLIKSNFSGRFKADILDAKGVFNSYFTNNNISGNKISIPKPMQISADIKDKSGRISIDNIIISSELVNGKGNIKADFLPILPIININLLLDDLDIDNIWYSRAANNKFSTSSKISSKGDQKQDKAVKIEVGEKQDTTKIRPPIFYKTVEMITKIKIKTAKYLGGKLNNINLYFVISKQGDISLRSLSLKMPDGGTLKVNGIFEHKNNILEFIGKIEILGQNLGQFLTWVHIKPKNLNLENLENYSMTANIQSSRGIIMLSNLHANLNENENFITGNIKIDRSKRPTKIISSFKIDNFRVEDYFLITGKNRYLYRGSLLNKSLWLNTINFDSDTYLNFNKLIYKDHIFNNQSLKLEFGQGYFKFADLELVSDNIDVKGHVAIDITDNNPKIEINLNIKKFQYISNNPKESEFIEQFFDFPSLNDFSGNIIIEIENINIDNLEVKNVSIVGEIEKGDLQLSNLKMDIYGGNLIYNGSILLKGFKTINGSFELTNIDNHQLLNHLLDIDNIHGISNISGVVNAVGRNKPELLYNLDIQAQFVSGNITIDRFGINDLIKQMLSPKKHVTELSKPLDIIFNEEYKSFFKNAKGALDIRHNKKISKFRIETSSTGINGVMTGSFDVHDNTFAAISQFIFLTGTRQKQIPINIAISYAGKLNNLNKTANVDQVNQYLEAVLSQ